MLANISRLFIYDIVVNNGEGKIAQFVRFT